MKKIDSITVKEFTSLIPNEKVYKVDSDGYMTALFFIGNMPSDLQIKVFSTGGKFYNYSLKDIVSGSKKLYSKDVYENNHDELAIQFLEEKKNEIESQIRMIKSENNFNN